MTETNEKNIYIKPKEEWDSWCTSINEGEKEKRERE